MPIFKSDEFLLNILPKNRLLGIDPGTKTLGIAISDSNLMVASPITTIKRKKINIDIKELLILVEEYTIAGIVIGWPLNMDGSIGPRCDSVGDFIKSLLNIKDLPILLQDERMSTMAIVKPMIKADLSRKKRSSRTDQLAACWILQSALDGIQKKM